MQTNFGADPVYYCLNGVTVPVARAILALTKEILVPAIESAIKDAIVRGARRQVRLTTTPLRREVYRLRRIVGQLRQELRAVREAAHQWQRMAQRDGWRPQVSDEELKTSRLSPRLIQKLRARLRISQAALARLVGVSAGAVVQWERGRLTPSEKNRKGVIALRKLGRREVGRLLTALPTRDGKGRRRRKASRDRKRRGQGAELKHRTR